MTPSILMIAGTDTDGRPASASFRIGMIYSSVNRFFMFIVLLCDEHY